MESAAINRFSLSDERQRALAELVSRVAQAGGGFMLFPPREVTSDPTVLESMSIVDRLAGSKWWLRLDDGGEELLTLADLVAFLHNLEAMKSRAGTAKRPGKKKADAGVQFNFDAAKLMQPDTVCVLLSKVSLQGLKK